MIRGIGILVKLVALAALTYSLLGRPDRELHALNLRLALGLPFPTAVRMEAQDVPGIVPSVELSAGRLDAIRNSADRSPTDFLLAIATVPRRITSAPPPSAFQGTSLAPLAASAAPWLLRRFEDSQDEQRRSLARQLLPIVKIAQQDDSDNGAMWLSEAIAQAYLNDEAAVSAALKEASGRPHWYAYEMEWWNEVRSSLVREGLPELDAASTLPFTFSSQMNLDLYFELSSQVAKAIDERRDAVFVDVASLAVRLNHTRWRGAKCRNIFSLMDSDVVDAMWRRIEPVTAPAQNSSGVPWEGLPVTVDYEARETEAAHRMQIWLRFVRATLPPDMAEAITADALLFGYNDPQRVQRILDSRELSTARYGSALFGIWAYLLLTFALATFILGIPALIPSRDVGTPRADRAWLYRTVMVACFLASAALLARSIHQFGDPLFWNTRLSREAETTLEAILYGVIGSLGLLGWKVVLMKDHRRSRELFTPFVAILLLGYLIAAHYTSAQRVVVTQKLVHEFTRAG